MTEPLGPTVVLIGGHFMIDTGSVLDSRQPIENDPWDNILRDALVGSGRWWEFALSLVQILVAQDSQPDPWVLVWAPKTVRQLKPGGGSKRTPIDKILGGAVSLMDDRFHRGTTIDASVSNEKYRILEHPLRYAGLVAARPPTAAFGAHPTSWDLIGLAPWNAVLRRWPSTTLIAPDTPLIRARMLDVSQWFKKGRMPDPEVRVVSHQEAEAEGREWQKFMAAHPEVRVVSHQEAEAEGREWQKFMAAGRAARDHRHVVVDADFRVTWFLDGGREENPEVVDAAFRFLLSRYDLKVGFWDLVRDRGLRESLLTREELTPPPERPLKMPQEMASAAAAAESQRLAKKHSEDAARKTLHNELWPLLKERKWETWKTSLDGTKSHPGTEYHLPLGKEICWSPAFPPVPVLYYSLKVHKEQSVLRLATPPLAFSGVAEYLEAHAHLLEAGVGKPPTGNVLWRFAGLGWEGDPTRWSEGITVIDRITEILAPDLSNLRDAALANHSESVVPRRTVVELDERSKIAGGGLRASVAAMSTREAVRRGIFEHLELPADSMQQLPARQRLLVEAVFGEFKRREGRRLDEAELISACQAAVPDCDASEIETAAHTMMALLQPPGSSRAGH